MKIYTERIKIEEIAQLKVKLKDNHSYVYGLYLSKQDTNI